MEILIGILILLVIMILGLPIYLGLLMSGLYVLVFTFNLPIDVILTSLYDGVAKWTLTAVPFFLFAGSLMERTNMSRRLVDSIIPWLIRVKGGLAITAIVANELFGAMSGSSAAAAGTIGRAMYPAVCESHDENFTLGLFASSGALAIIMPPSITMILFATATSSSLGKLFLAGIVPALLIGVILIAYIIIKSKPIPKGEKFNFHTAIKKTIKGIPILILPVVVLGGIYMGLFTPTEAGAVSAVYCLILPLILREIGLKQIIEALKDTVQLTAQIFILIGSSAVFVQALSIAQVTTKMAHALEGTSPLVFLMILNIILLIVGAFFDPSSAILVIAPVVAPIARMLGIDIIHLGIVMTVNIAIGMFTPPFGLNLFILQSIFNKRLEQLAKSVIPFFFLYLIVLVILTYFPQLYMWIPNSLV